MRLPLAISALICLLATVSPALSAPAQVTAATTQSLTAIERAAAFRAAGFRREGRSWHQCEREMRSASYSPGEIESIADRNGDGLPEAVIIEAGAGCYGNTGTQFSLVSKQRDGSWKLMTSELGIAKFLATRGAGNWPDIEVGGPGFCFEVLRWNGRAYALSRRQYEGKPCRLPR
jgi:hypothetical protein